MRVVCIWIIFGLVLVNVLTAQDQIFESAPDFFEQSSESEMEEWVSVLQQWRAEKWTWPNHVNLLYELPWVDESWIRTTLSTQSSSELEPMLNHAFSDAASAATIRYLYHLDRKSLKSRLARVKPQAVQAEMRTALRTRLIPGSDQVLTDQMAQFQFRTNKLELSWMADQASHHQYNRLTNPTTHLAGLSYRGDFKSLKWQVYAGPLRYAVGSGLLSNTARRVNLATNTSFLSHSQRLLLWQSKDHSNALNGTAAQLVFNNWEWILIQGKRSWLHTASSSLVFEQAVSRSSLWQQRVEQSSSETAHQVVGLQWTETNERLRIALNMQRTDFGGLYYQDVLQMNRIDSELSFAYQPTKEMGLKGHIAHYIHRWQYQVQAEVRQQSYRLRFFYSEQDQPEIDLLRGIRLGLGSFGQERMLAMQTDFYQNGRSKLGSLLLGYAKKQDIWNLENELEDRFFLEAALNVKTVSNHKLRFMFRLRNQADDSSIGRQNRMQILAQSTIKVHSDFILNTNLTMNMLDVTARNPSLTLSNLLRYRYKSLHLNLRYSQMMVDERSPMQRLDSWSSGHLIRDILVRSSSGEALQLQLAYPLGKKIQLSVSITREWYNELRTVSVNGLNQRFQHRTMINTDVRLSL